MMDLECIVVFVTSCYLSAAKWLGRCFEVAGILEASVGGQKGMTVVRVWIYFLAAKGGTVDAIAEEGEEKDRARKKGMCRNMGSLGVALRKGGK